jgi:hypothetical protein
MPFEFGVFHEFPRYAGVTDAEAFTQSFAQVDRLSVGVSTSSGSRNCTSSRSDRSRPLRC